MGAWVTLCLFAILLAMTGGASRSDEIQIISLRGFSAIFLVVAFYKMRFADVRSNRVLLALLGGLLFVIVIQLLPLPSGLWKSLPARGEIADLDSALGISELWRPLVLAPMRGWNALGSLVVPLAGLLLALAFRASSRTLLQITVGLGVGSAILGVLQLVAGKGSALYFYRISNWGSPVGFFANENHSVMFAACAMLAAARLGIRSRTATGLAGERIAYATAYFLVLMVALIGGSRAGFAVVLGAVGISIVMIALATSEKTGSRRSGIRQTGRIQGRTSLFGIAAALFVVPGVFLMFDRVPAWQSLIAEDSFADLRWSFWPVVLVMLEAHWIVGIGFGSFEQVYYIYEPSELLRPAYINQAHNDWMQVILEGGVASIVLLVSMAYWVANRILAMSSDRKHAPSVVFYVGVFAIFGLASIVDYPLRTPIFQVVGVWLLAALARDASAERAT